MAIPWLFFHFVHFLGTRLGFLCYAILHFLPFSFYDMLKSVKSFVRCYQVPVEDSHQLWFWLCFSSSVRSDPATLPCFYPIPWSPGVTWDTTLNPKDTQGKERRGLSVVCSHYWPKQKPPFIASWNALDISLSMLASHAFQRSWGIGSISCTLMCNGVASP